MGLNKEQSHRINHAERHAKGGSDQLLVNNLQGETGTTERLLSVSPAGNIVTTETDVIYVTNAALITSLQNETNWSAISFTATGGFQGQRVVSTIKSYFYECVADNVWVRYPIAMSSFHMYLNVSPGDMAIRLRMETATNWVDGVYTGAAITGTFQGQAHFDSLYKYDAVADNRWIRTPRQ